MITYDTVTRWLAAYVAAWQSYQPQAIGALFSEAATYRYNPFDEPVQGREAIVASWLAERDAPGTYTAEYKPIALEGQTAVAQGRTLYYAADGQAVERQFDNIFVLRFDDEGLCTDFCEWYMQPQNQP